MEQPQRQEQTHTGLQWDPGRSQVGSQRDPTRPGVTSVGPHTTRCDLRRIQVEPSGTQHNQV